MAVTKGKLQAFMLGVWPITGRLSGVDGRRPSQMSSLIAAQVQMPAGRVAPWHFLIGLVVNLI